MQTADQLMLIAQARWAALRNSLRSTTARANLVAHIALAGLGTVVVLFLALVLAAGAYRATTHHRFEAFGGMFLVVFIFWQIGPLILETTAPALDFRILARFPISFTTFALLYFAYGLLNPITLGSIAWLLAICTGTLLARPGWVWRLLVIIPAFALVNLLVTEAVTSFVESTLRTRRARERFVGLVMTLAVLAQVVIYVIIPRHHAVYARLAHRVEAGLPSAPASLAIWHGAWHDFAQAALVIGAWGGAAFLLLGWLLRRTYRGEVPSENGTRTAAGARQGWRFPLAGDAFSAMLEKEIRYARHDNRTLLSVLAGPLAAMVVVFGAGVLPFARSASTAVYAGVAGYALFAVGELSYNSLAYESTGFDRWLLAPQPLARLFAAKNLVNGVLLAVSFALTTLVVSLGPGFSWRSVGPVGLGFAAAGLLTLAFGNFFSTWFPTRMEYGVMRGKKVSEATVLLGILGKAVTFGLVVGVWKAAARTGIGWAPYMSLVLVFLAAVVFYRYSIDAAAQRAAADAERIRLSLAA